MNERGAEIWAAVSDAFGQRRGESARRLWLQGARAAGLSRGLFTLDVGTPAAKAAIDARYLDELQELFRELTGSTVRIVTRVGPDPAQRPPAPLPPLPGSLLRPGRFVVTPSNRLAHEAVERLALTPRGWNPLTLHGPPGSGKTELARHALARLRQLGEAQDPLVLSAPALTRDVSSAARSGRLAALRAEWGARDLLVLDEVHRLRGQPRCRAEAAALMHDLLAAGRRVLVLSRHAPAQLKGFDERLPSLLQGGMVIPVAEPDTDDRIAMLTAIAEELPRPPAPEVVPALAARCPGTLADAVRVLQRAALDADERDVPLDLALLGHRLAGPTPAEATLGSVVDAVATVAGVQADRIRTREKSRDVAAARHLCVYLATRSLGFSARQVCRSLGHVSPSLAGYARRVVEARRQSDAAYDRLVHDLQARLQGAQRDFQW